MKYRIAISILVAVAHIMQLAAAVKLPQNPNPEPLKWWQSDIVRKLNIKLYLIYKLNLIAN